MNPLGLYSASLGGTIQLVPSNPAGQRFVVVAGKNDLPIVHVSVYDAMRFANWLHNGQGAGDTETGAYTLTGGTPVPSNGLTVTRNPDARFFLPNENEWYKAAYYEPSERRYYSFPTVEPPQCVPPSLDSGSSANCYPANQSHGFSVLDVGSYSLSAGFHGTFDQAGNVWEHTDDIFLVDGVPARPLRGGAWNYGWTETAASSRLLTAGRSVESYDQGFRLAAAPLPPQCSDGVDNDGDGLIDFDGGLFFWGVALAEPDPHCSASPARNSERPRSCGLGPELVLVLVGLGRLATARRAALSA